MGILDEAIREHLELKRQHGAGDSELKQLEDEAFGQAERPGDEEASDPPAEAPTEFMAQPDAPRSRPAGASPTIADLQEPPPRRAGASEGRGGAGGRGARREAPAEEEQPAMEHEIVADEPEPAEPAEAAEAEPTVPQPKSARPSPNSRPRSSTSRRSSSRPPSPSDEELAEEERRAPPRTGRAARRPRGGRGGRGHVQAPPPTTRGVRGRGRRLLERAAPLRRTRPGPRGAARRRPASSRSRAHRGADPRGREPAASRAESPSTRTRGRATTSPSPPRRDEDVLDETPDFLEEAPEDDQLWFEQKPPKDFDFDD